MDPADVVHLPMLIPKLLGTSRDRAENIGVVHIANEK
jgi:hypothetical protein